VFFLRNFSFTFTQPINLWTLDCGCIINSIYLSPIAQLYNIVTTLIKVNMLWTMCLNSLFPVYFHSMCWCSVTVWQPTVFYSILVLYLRTQSILKRKNLKELQQPFCDLLLFCNQFCAFSQRTVQLTVKLISFSWNCDICLSERNIVCILSCNVLTFR
jgi:hypothetical protein